MAKYRITGPDGGTYEVEAPNDASESQVLDYVRTQSSGAPSSPASPKIKHDGFLFAEYDDGSRGLGPALRPIVSGIKSALPAAAQYRPGTNDVEGADALVRSTFEPGAALSPVTAGKLATTTASHIWRNGAARSLPSARAGAGTETGAGIATRRATEAATDSAAHESLGIRPFGPAFNQGPVASIGKQITETPVIGGPLRGALDETYEGMTSAAHRIADDISPLATAETAGAAAQRGLDRFRFSNLADLDPPTVRGLGIDPVAPVPRPTYMSQGAQEVADQAAPFWQRNGRTATTSRGVDVPAARPLSESMTTRTTAEMLDDAQLARLVRTPATQTSVATRAEALYERAWRQVPAFMRGNDTANPMLLATVNSANAVRGIERQVASEISGQRAINGNIADWLSNPHRNMTLATMRDIRTEIGRALSNYNPMQQGLDRTQLKTLYGAISRDMEIGLETLANRAAVRVGRNTSDTVAHGEARQAAGALQAFRTADRYYRQSMERMDRFSQVLQAQSPEQAANRLVKAALSGSKGDIRQFRAAMAGLRAEERAEFGSMVVRSLGEPMPSARGMVQDRGFSAQSFVTNYQKLSPEARSLMFTGQHQRALDEFFRVANRVANVEALANTSRTGTNSLNMAGAIGGVSSFMAGDFATPLAIIGGGGALSVLMSRPEYVNWMTGYLRYVAAVRNGTAGASNALLRHVAGLERMSGTNPELKAVHAAIASSVGDAEPAIATVPARTQPKSRVEQFTPPTGMVRGMIGQDDEPSIPRGAVADQEDRMRALRAISGR